MPKTDTYLVLEKGVYHMIFINPLMPKWCSESPQMPKEFGLSFTEKDLDYFLTNIRKRFEELRKENIGVLVDA